MFYRDKEKLINILEALDSKPAVEERKAAQYLSCVMATYWIADLSLRSTLLIPLLKHILEPSNFRIFQPLDGFLMLSILVSKPNEAEIPILTQAIREFFFLAQKADLASIELIKLQALIKWVMLQQDVIPSKKEMGSWLLNVIMKSRQIEEESTYRVLQLAKKVVELSIVSEEQRSQVLKHILEVLRRRSPFSDLGPDYATQILFLLESCPVEMGGHDLEDLCFAAGVDPSSITMAKPYSQARLLEQMGGFMED